MRIAVVALLVACAAATTEPLDEFESLLITELTTPELEAEYCRRPTPGRDQCRPKSNRTAVVPFRGRSAR